MKTIQKVMLALTATGVLSLWAEDVLDMFVESVQSKTRTQFVDTGIVPKSGTKVDLDFALIETGNNAYFPVMAGVKNASGQEVRIMGYTYGIRAYLNGRYSGDTSNKGNLVPYHTETTFCADGEIAASRQGTAARLDGCGHGSRGQRPRARRQGRRRLLSGMVGRGSRGDIAVALSRRRTVG